MTREADQRRQRRRLRQIAFISCVLALLLAAWFVRGEFSLQTLLGFDSTGDTLALYALSTLNFIALVTLTLVLLRHLVKLARERRERRLGAQFKTRMVVGSIALTLLPTAMLFLFSFWLIDTSIRVFFQPTRQMVTDARGILDAYVNVEAHELRATARQLVRARNVREMATVDRATAEKEFARDARNFNLALIELREGGRDVLRVDGPSAELGPIFRDAVEAARQKVDAGEVYQGQARNTDDNAAIFIVLGVPVAAKSATPRGLVVVRRFPAELAEKFDSLDDQQRASEALVNEQGSIRARYVATLSLVTLIVLFGTVWIALYVSRTVTEPIQALVEATDEVASGNLEHRIDAVADGELGTLVESFNAMAAQLGESRARLEERRAYIETILASLSTGVVSLDAEGRVTTVNAAAVRMLALGPGPYELEGLAAAVGPARAKVETLLRRARRSGSASSEMELRLMDGTALPVAVRVSSLHGPEGEYAGAVMTVEDVSELSKAERTAAWNEVARRMAHEIKNPLTPIQLSAERMRLGLRRDSTSATPRYASIVEECTATIVREVAALQHMVEEFSSYARMPRPRVEQADLNAIVRSALGVYRGRADGVVISADLAGDELPLVVDPEQIRRVIVNLVDNALEAVATSPTRSIRIATRSDAARDIARLEVEDTGHGIDDALHGSLFLPYFSTSKRGTGLGLAIVHHIVGDHRGRVWAEPNEPSGARFVVELPTQGDAQVASGQWPVVSTEQLTTDH